MESVSWRNQSKRESVLLNRVVRENTCSKLCEHNQVSWSTGWYVFTGIIHCQAIRVCNKCPQHRSLSKSEIRKASQIDGWFAKVRLNGESSRWWNDVVTNILDGITYCRLQFCLTSQGKRTRMYYKMLLFILSLWNTIVFNYFIL